MTQLEIQLIETVVLIVLALLIKILATKSVNRFLAHFDFDLKRKRITVRIINLFLWIFIAIVLAGIWNIDREGLVVFITSIITVMGVAFFAQWSILSNITASLILFFNHPMKIGETIHILDKEYDIEGELTDISFFFMYIRTKENHLVTIPTSVVLAKTIVRK
ncbi:MAG: mechanosensitive ion channel domain-containing protein [Crocinitomicaceae bacterium]|jgi:small-conductance mechanosensitive channel